MRKNKRLEALNALADIRRYARLVAEVSHVMRATPSEGKLPMYIVDKFNIVATYLGADSDWCKP
jgi:hypothetical protein